MNGSRTIQSHRCFATTHRKGGTMLTADEVAAVAGGAPASEPIAVDATDYPRNPAGPVTTESEETKFNRK